MSGSDREAIVQLVNLYGLAVDTQRWALFDRIFTADADADFGEGSHWTDLAAFKRDFALFHDMFDSTQHAMTNHIVEVAGDRADAITYGFWTLIRRGTEGGDVWRGSGWYDDRLVRTAAGWRIARRICRVIDWSGNPRVQGIEPDGVQFALQPLALRREAEAGRVGLLKAIAG